MQYRCTPLGCSLSLSKMLNKRQIICQLDAQVSSAHIIQGKQSWEATKSHRQDTSSSATYIIRSPYHALYCGFEQTKYLNGTCYHYQSERYVQCKVRVIPQVQIWQIHREQLWLCYNTEKVSSREASTPTESQPTLKEEWMKYRIRAKCPVLVPVRSVSAIMKIMRKNFVRRVYNSYKKQL